ncbi:hypothetical protein L873DRAFT_1862818 [Choiromyces venosus 120613-1]|uniref:Uncharacterized protein n=1 Tax=Choiromyces venosus 120613-1 TaxID=1336337 RepID=A0A3N4J5E7_9PEZI|nr:hypothetical protein L873DRAFT_1862818 [Choiromyces venosus 120613-1]
MIFCKMQKSRNFMLTWLLCPSKSRSRYLFFAFCAVILLFPKLRPKNSIAIFSSVQPLCEYPKRISSGIPHTFLNHSAINSLALSMIVGFNVIPSAQTPSITVTNSHVPSILLSILLYLFQ